MMRLVLALLALPALAAAQEFPALYDVAGVAADDVLNVRAAPDASAEIVGTLAPDARNVEVVAPGPDRDWGRVNAGERSGWASLAYLARQGGQPAGEPITSFHCAGTEPFWSFDVTAGEGRFATPEGPGETTALEDPVMANGRTDSWALRGLSGGLTAIVTRQLCSDGMSDRAYGLSLDLILSDGGMSYYSGCCELSP